MGNAGLNQNLVRWSCRNQTACVLTHWVVILKAKRIISASGIKWKCEMNDFFPHSGLPKTHFVWTNGLSCSKFTPFVEPEHVGPFNQ